MYDMAVLKYHRHQHSHMHACINNLVGLSFAFNAWAQYIYISYVEEDSRTKCVFYLNWPGGSRDLGLQISRKLNF